MQAQEDPGTRQRILSTAAHLFASQGFHGTRLRDIARAVGIQKASLFHHFPSKADLYRAALDHGVAEAAEGLRAALDCGGSPEEKVRALISAYVGYVARHPERTKLFLRLSLGEAPIAADFGEGRRLVATVADFIATSQRSGAFQALDPVALVLGVAGMVAYFFIAAEILAPTWAASGAGEARVQRIVTEITLRALEPHAAGLGDFAGAAPVSTDHLEP